MIITNANIVTPENNFIGSLEFETDFMNISDSKHHGLGALDFEGDYLLPGFIELQKQRNCLARLRSVHTGHAAR